MPILLMVLVGVLVSVHPAAGDIYRYVDADGVECFTDTPITGRGAVYLKETARKKSARRNEKPVPSESPYKGGHPAPEAPQAPAPSLSPFPLQGRITSPVGLRHDPIDGSLRHHQGVDIALASGTPVRPVNPGVVVFSGTRPGYGNTVIVEHADGMTTLYAHNSVNLLSEGTIVEEGSVLALSGSTGRSTGPHLHFEAWKGGSNITSEIIASRYGLAGGGQMSTDDGIRRIIQADGSLLFTNLPRLRQ